MKKSLFSIILLLAVIGLQAQTSLNWKGFDTCELIKFKADTFRLSKTFILSNAENKLLALIYDDTANAGRVHDSMSAEVGYQLGAPIVSLIGKLDTLWTNKIVIDTINSQTSNKCYDPKNKAGAASWGLSDAQEISIRPHGQIDTTIAISSSGVFLPFAPFWSPYIRFYLKGMAGNGGTFIRGKFVFEQRGWIYTKGM
jgi:hypothetical protein